MLQETVNQLLALDAVSQRAAISTYEEGMQWNMHKGFVLGSFVHSSVRVANLLGRLRTWDEVVDLDTHCVDYELTLK